MAFDLVSYITQQVAQQYPSLLAEEGKDKKQIFITHLVSLHISKLIVLYEKDSSTVYQQIQSQDHHWLNEQIQQHSRQEAFFQSIQSKLANANDKIAHTLLAELFQLDQNANLGIAGIRELLEGQYTWIQNQVESWFWDSIGQPQYKLLTPKANDHAEFQQVMKEFSQMIHQQAQQTTDHQQIENEIATTPIAQCYVILNPIIAALIILLMFKTIF